VRKHEIKDTVDDEIKDTADDDINDTADANRDADHKRLGLVSHHGYAVIGCIKLSEGQFLARLCNPCENYEWKGPWNESDSRWPQFAAEVEASSTAGGPVRNMDDSAFFIPTAEFRKYFGNGGVCCCEIREGMAPLDPAVADFKHPLPVFMPPGCSYSH
jgi:hypothetical protein